MSSVRTTTYYYDPKSNGLIFNKFDRLTVAATPSSTQRPSTPELGYYSSPASTPTTSPKVKSIKMARTVSFGQPEGARDPLVDEKEVMRTFHRHVGHCDTCYASLKSWRSGAPLCQRGHNYVVDMRPYFYCKLGKPYSMIDRDQRGEHNRVFVPTEYKYVATLFEGLNGGYNTNPSRQASRPKPKIVVHQPTEAVYQESRRQERPTIMIPATRPTQRSERYHEEEGKRYREPRSRGSLYHEDERRRHRHGEEVVYVSSPRSPRYRL